MVELGWNKWTMLPDRRCQKKPDDTIVNCWNLQNLTVGDVIFVKYVEHSIKTYRWDGELFRLVKDPNTLTEKQKAELMVAMMGR